MRRLLGAFVVLFVTCGVAQAAPIFTDGFEDGNHSANPTWQILTVPDVNDSHASRWTTACDANAIAGSCSERWDDWQGGAGCEAGFALGECFPLGLLYQEPTIGSRPRDVGSYTIFFRGKAQDNGPLGANLGIGGYGTGTGLLMWPTQPRQDPVSGQQEQFAGGFAAGLFYDPNVDPDVQAGIIFLEVIVRTNVAQSGVCSAVFLNVDANMSPADFFANTHDVRFTVRRNSTVELTIDGQYYGQRPASRFTVDCGSVDRDNVLGLTDMEDVMLAGLANNLNRYDSVAYDNAPPADANGNKIPDAFEGGLNAVDNDCDGIDNAYDPDDDNDGIPDWADPDDNDPSLPNNDGDGRPDACDSDDDNDTCTDALDGDPFFTDDDCSSCGGTPSFDCDGDGVPNGCELAPSCGTDICDPDSLCDTNPPKVTFVEPKRNQVYLRDHMAQPTGITGTPVTVSSLTVEVTATDAESSVSSVAFELDGEVVPACAPDDSIPTCVQPANPPSYSFRWNISGEENGTHEIVAIAEDRFTNVGSTSRFVSVVDLSAITDMTATDVTDQYAMIIQPRDGAFQGSNYYAIAPRNGAYEIVYRVMEYPTVSDALGRTVTTCSANNQLYVVSFENVVSGMTTPGAFPGFWHDPAHTVANAQGTCVNGTYTARIPVADLAGVQNQPVGLWAYVDVPDRASTTSPVGSVDSASGFFNILKAHLPQDPASDRLDEAPTPVFIRP